MRIIKQSWSFDEPVDGTAILRKIERAGRVCYKTEHAITLDSAGPRIRKWIDSGHHSVIEHHSIMARIVTDRGVTHEIVRHRLASYSQESTRYCNYGDEKFGKEITIVWPVWFYPMMETRLEIPAHPLYPQYEAWHDGCQKAEDMYFKLLELGQSPQEARSVLPNSLKTEIVMTCNIREWRHFFTLRADKKAHPQMRALAEDMLRGFRAAVPVLFDDVHPEVA